MQTVRATTNVVAWDATELGLAIDAFESAVQPQGRFGAVFERDDETAYFYLLDLQLPEGRQIIGAFCLTEVVAMPPDIKAQVAWTPEGDMAGLLIEGRLAGVFDLADVRSNSCEGRGARPNERGRFLDR